MNVVTRKWAASGFGHIIPKCPLINVEEKNVATVLQRVILKPTFPVSVIFLSSSRKMTRGYSETGREGLPSYHYPQYIYVCIFTSLDVM